MGLDLSGCSGVPERYFTIRVSRFIDVIQAIGPKLMNSLGSCSPDRFCHALARAMNQSEKDFLMQPARSAKALLCIWLILAMAPLVCCGQFTYSTTTNAGVITITRFTAGGSNSIVLTIPASMNGYPVAVIGDSAFENTPRLCAVTLPGTVTNIGNNAFSVCESLTNLALPDGLRKIGNGAFRGCSSLSAITIPGTVTNIGSVAFEDCPELVAISVDVSNESFSSVSGVLFNKSADSLIACPGAQSGIFYISNNVTSIGPFAFSYCTKLVSVAAPSTVTNIGPGAFNYCTGLTNFQIPNSVSQINSDTFDGCSALLNVTIPLSVTNIGLYAFAECLSLSNIVIPASVITLDRQAFWESSALSSIDVDNLNPVYCDRDGILFSKDQTSLIVCPMAKTGVYTVPNTVTNVGTVAFHHCKNLTEIVFPNSVQAIGEFVCFNCTSLFGVTLGDGITTIPVEAFYQCNNLTNVMIGASVTNIDQYAFKSCGALRGIVLPASLKNVGGNAFAECSSLANISIPSGVTNIDTYAFEGCSALVDVTLPNGLKNIGSSAFSGCTFAHLAIPDSVTNIGANAFSSCTNLASLSLPNGMNNLQSSTLLGCTGLRTLIVPAGVTNLSTQALASCSNLVSVYFRGNAPILGSSVFSGDTHAFLCYLPGSAGWTSSLGGRPTVPWKPQIDGVASGYGVTGNQFGFVVNWASGMQVVVEARGDAVGSSWSPVQTNSMSADAWLFNDPQWKSFSSRIYRVRMP